MSHLEEDWREGERFGHGGNACHAHLFIALMQITGSKVCSPSLQTPCGSMALSRRSSLASGGRDVALAAADVEGSPLSDAVGDFTADGAVIVSSFAVSVSSLMALKELDSQMETSGRTSSVHPSHCRLLPTRERYLQRQEEILTTQKKPLLQGRRRKEFYCLPPMHSMSETSWYTFSVL